MKRVTVKDKILLHLSQYQDVEAKYEVSFDLTQDGISASVGITRGHVAITLTGLKNEGTVAERLARVRGVSRQRKVYYLTRKGITYAVSLRNTLHRRTVIFKDMEGNEVEITFSDLGYYLFPYVNQYLNLVELINHLSGDNIFDSKSFVEEFKKDAESKAKAQPQTQPKPKPNPEIQPQPEPKLTAPESREEAVQKAFTQPNTGQPLQFQHPPVQPASQAQAHAQVQGSEQQRATNTNEQVPMQPAAHPHLYPSRPPNQPPNPAQNPPSQQNFLQPNPYYYPPANDPYASYRYYSYLYPYYYQPRTPEQIKDQLLGGIKAFFALSLLISIPGLLLVLGLPSDMACAPGFFPVFIFGFVFALIGFSKGLKRIAFIGNEGRRIMLAAGIYYITAFIIILATIFFHLTDYIVLDEAAPVFGLMFLFIFVLSMVKPLKVQIRFELAIIVGVFSILFGIFSSLLIPQYYFTNPFLYSPFWILFGVISIIVGHELVRQSEYKKLSNIIKFGSVGAGIFLILVTALRLYDGNYDVGQLLLSYITDGCWCGLGVYLVVSRFLKESYSEVMMESIKLSLPLGIGLLFLLFGIYLLQAGKILEGIIEIIIGIVVLRYGLPKKAFTEGKKKIVQRFTFPTILLVTVCVTFYFILIG